MNQIPKFTCEKIIKLHSWIPGKLISLYVTRDKDYYFKAGQFARIGISDKMGIEDSKNLWRAYSIVSAPQETTYLEFYFIVIPNGTCSQILAKLVPNDELYVQRVSYGFLTIDQFINGEDLWLIASGTGLSAYISILRDLRTWSLFKNIILVHGVRQFEELTYGEEIKRWEQININYIGTRFKYLPITTREKFPGMPQERLTTLLKSGELERLVGRDLDSKNSRVMLCGNPTMLKTAREILRIRGFCSGRNGMHGNLVLEKYW